MAIALSSNSTSSKTGAATGAFTSTAATYISQVTPSPAISQPPNTVNNFRVNHDAPTVSHNDDEDDIFVLDSELENEIIRLAIRKEQLRRTQEENAKLRRMLEVLREMQVDSNV